MIRRLMRSGLAVLVWVTGWPGLLNAHEIGTTRVAATFEESGRFEIEIVTDAASLADKLETVAGQPRASVVTRGAAPSGAQIAALDAVFRERIRIAFDEGAYSICVGSSVC